MKFTSLIGLPLIVIPILLAAIAGWCLNIHKFIIDITAGTVDTTPEVVLVIARAIGIPFGPLGAVLGFF